MRPDHMILAVNDAAASVAFYTRVLGFTDEGPRPPFTQLRVSPDYVILLGEWPTKGGEHLAFAVDPGELERVLARVRDAGIPYGDAFDSVGSQRAPGTADGAHGVTQSFYVNDPSGHLIEIVSNPPSRA
jgi:catechol 2,3-dioxygenase-like lactoylglutathione lyase family enzyme